MGKLVSFFIQFIRQLDIFYRKNNLNEVTKTEINRNRQKIAKLTALENTKLNAAHGTTPYSPRPLLSHGVFAAV